MKVTLVYNKKSGSSLGLSELRKRCKAHTIEIEHAVRIGDGFGRRLQPVIRAGKTILAVGGDGTISAVAGLVAGTKAVLAPLPGGTLNHFTKDLGIAQDIDEALAGIAKGAVRKIDAAKVNDTIFINNSSIGLYPSSLRERGKLEGVIGKWPAAFVAAVKAFVRFRMYTLEINNATIRTPFIFIGNNHYDIDAAGLPKRSVIDGATLCLFIAHTTSRWGLLKIALSSLFKNVSSLDEFAVHEVKAVTIESKRPLIRVSHDGETSRLSPPLHYEVLPGQLRVRY